MFKQAFTAYSVLTSLLKNTRFIIAELLQHTSPASSSPLPHSRTPAHRTITHSSTLAHSTPATRYLNPRVLDVSSVVEDQVNYSDQFINLNLLLFVKVKFIIIHHHYYKIEMFLIMFFIRLYIVSLFNTKAMSEKV